MGKKFYASTGIMVALFLIGLVLARPAKLRAVEVGGANLETATLLEAGEHDLGMVSKETPKYVKIKVKGGQQLEAKFLGEASYMYSTMYIPPSKEDIGDSSGADLPHVYHFAPGNLDTGDGGEVYFGITRQGGLDPRQVKVSFALSDVSDAKSGRDAGDSFAKALAIEPGSYKGYLNYFMYKHKGIEVPRGTDSEDFYILKLKKGQALTVSVSPHSSVKLRLRIYDVMRAIKVEQSSESAGAIVTGRFVAPKDQDVYFSVRYYEKDITIHDAQRIENWAGKYYDFTADVSGVSSAPEAQPAERPATSTGDAEKLKPGKHTRNGDATFELSGRVNQVVALKVIPARGQGAPELTITNSKDKTPSNYAINYLGGNARELQVKVSPQNTDVRGGKGTFIVSIAGMGDLDYRVEYAVKPRSCL